MLLLLVVLSHWFFPVPYPCSVAIIFCCNIFNFLILYIYIFIFQYVLVFLGGCSKEPLCFVVQVSFSCLGGGLTYVGVLCLGFCFFVCLFVMSCHLGDKFLSLYFVFILRFFLVLPIYGAI